MNKQETASPLKKDMNFSFNKKSINSDSLSVHSDFGNLEYKQILHNILKDNIVNNKLFLAHNKCYYLKNVDLVNCLIKNLSTLGDFYRYNSNSDYFHNKVLSKNYMIYYTTEEASHLKSLHVSFTIFTNTIEEKDIIISKLDELLKNYINNDITVDINYHFLANGCVNDIRFGMKYTPELPNINYPYIKDMDLYVEKYFNSESPVIILMGEPGTGKTRFIRYLLSRLRKKHNEEMWAVFFTSDPEMLKETSFFINFMASASKALVVEDMDKSLHKRVEGNEVMYSLLGVSDGVIDIGYKKMIFSTNLPSINNIDSAIIRKGRCFDIMEFRALTYEESIDFLAANGRTDVDLPVENHTLANLYAILNDNPNSSVNVKPVGFDTK